ncbi:hypothetical protein EJ06DRAFT_581814 [Trichodelitschia bisporula]|uniref:Peptidase S59 domain-containing protein n=1 Tax=Trichodelitschia bisporula TaxID=703511 RepID=A0A6G1HY32_9PEZI|nr:hypothetical protein EJ06DRAFT_581814 [Trichodelitschia bisporula]
MSTFGGGGFGSGGFGSNSTNTTGFGGFGANASNTNNATASGFGSSNTGFGSNTNTGGGLFGSSTGGGGFGSGGFGAPAASGSGFGGNKTGFGTATTSSGSVFGGGTATAGSGFGGFGSGGTTSTFGGGANTSNTFGAKPSFGAPATTGGVFGSGGTASGFGNTTTTGTGFGASANPTFAASQQTNNGTGSVQFQPHVDKDPGTSTVSNHYQTISTMPNYQGFSLEELRIADYAQGRKFGTQTGQVGGFGASTGFGGGFGSTAAANPTSGFGPTPAATNNVFGGGTNTGSGFGTQATTNPGFGASTTSSVFGAPKPAGTSIFGSGATTSTPATNSVFGNAGTGFGGTTNTTGGFGQSNTGTSSLFNNAPKPATGFAGFGGGATNTAGGFGSNTATGFGQPAASTTNGLFGNTPATSATTGFGSAPTATSGGFGGFGQNPQQQPQQQTGSNVFGGFGAANPQQKPSIFGTGTAAGGTSGVFGNAGQQQQPQQPAASGLFSSTNTQAQGGLFGNKPQGAGSLFPAANTGASGGVFGNTQQQPAQGGSLFGPTQQQPGGNGLFGPKPTLNTGFSMFPNQNNTQPQQGSSIFGGQQQQPQANSSFLGNSQQSQMQQNTLTASIMDNAYGNPQLFASLGSPSQATGPIATPLSASQKNKKPAIIPHYRINPASSSRLITPQKRPPGYGFSYSTYGTPGSAVSNASPIGYNNNLLGGNMQRSLSKSLSTSNLRNSFTAEDSVLLPGAFSNATKVSGTGSLKRLNINKNMHVRRSLFGNPAYEEANGTSLRKKVSFDTTTNGSNETASSIDQNGTSSSALVRTESPVREIDNEPASGLATISETRATNGDVRPALPDREALLTHRDQEPGAYWMKPSKQAIENMSRQERSHVQNFTVGRNGCGQIVFSEVDLTNIPLDDICGKIAVLEVRSATVYGEGSPVPKPPVGKGLNVPSTITLDNSWPRSKAGRLPVQEKKGARFEKHIERLKRVPDTEYVNYDTSTGQWTFKVEHYTTYALDYDEDESMLSNSMLSPPPDTATPVKATPSANAQTSPGSQGDMSMPSPPDSSLDDTFEFKRPKGKFVPGQFDGESYDAEYQEDAATPESFLDERSAGSSEADVNEVDVTSDEDELVMAQDQEMAGSFPMPGRTVEQENASAVLINTGSPTKPKSILKPTGLRPFGTPVKAGQIVLGADWTEQLLRTASPKKQDRNALRAVQASALKNREDDRKPLPTPKGPAFNTSIDLMNSLFGNAGKGTTLLPTKQGAKKGFEFPYAKRARTSVEVQTMNTMEKEFHHTTKPSWGPDGALVHIFGSDAPKITRLFMPLDLLAKPIIVQQRVTGITIVDDVPKALPPRNFDFSELANSVSLDTPAGAYEHQIWQLASILFDNFDVEFPEHLTVAQYTEYDDRLRKAKLSEFWKKLVCDDAIKQVNQANSSEEMALMYLSGGMVVKACKALVDGRNFHLATLVAQIPGDDVFRSAIQSQLVSWEENSTLTDISDHTRAIYELLAGNTYCKPRTTGGAQRVSSFNLSSRFCIDWRRSFGLRLWYGSKPDEDVSAAVVRMEQDTQAGNEAVKPIPWFMEQNPNQAWDSAALASRVDLLWGLLKLYSNHNLEDPVSVESIATTENTASDALNSRLAFQVATLLSARGFGTPDTEAAIDRLANSFSASLSTITPPDGEALRTATWVLMHLSSAPMRATRIKALLETRADILDPPAGPLFVSLTGQQATNGLPDLGLPAKWLFAAKAMHARAVLRDPVAEARFLLDAGEWAAAHDVVCHTVGPAAVISEDFELLRSVLQGLKSGLDLSPEGADAWHSGAGVYMDYVDLKDLHEGRHGPMEGRVATESKHVINQLLNVLEHVSVEGKDQLECAALKLVGEFVAKLLLRASDTNGFGHEAYSEKAADKARLLRIPLTEDSYLKHSLELSVDYYRAVMASA